MMLCDAAQVADGKLFILGGGWSLIGPDPMPSAIAIKVDVGWHEATRAHHWELFLMDEDGRRSLSKAPTVPSRLRCGGDFEVGRPEGVPEGSPVDVAVAVNFSPLPSPTTRASPGASPSTEKVRTTGSSPFPQGRRENCQKDDEVADSFPEEPGPVLLGLWVSRASWSCCAQH